ncbi:MAG: response regulator [Bacteroidales bacterium]|nr:response regulator [Bacteroidales bacterium]MBN2820306.1 response regulator [Bacteroidales bacterium]
MKKILIIEDEENIRDSISDILTFHDFQTYKAKDGKEGIYLALEQKPDLILCDIMMPQMDGYKVLEVLKSNSDFVYIPFIFLTAKTAREDFREGMSLGADDYIFKPFTADELVNSINTRLAKVSTIKDEAQKQLQKVIKELNESSSHDFNTPLNGIIGLSELLLHQVDHYSKEKISNFIQGINEAGKKLKIVLENILLYKQLVAVKHNEISDSLFFEGEYALFEDIVARDLYDIADDFGRTDDLLIALQEATLNISKRSFNKIIEEVLSNAFKFSTNEKPVSVIGKIKKEKYTVEIIDFGVGFNSLDVDKIAPFTKFNTGELAQDGNGLGLFIAKTLIELRKGTLNIVSEINGQTTVKLEFMLA